VPAGSRRESGRWTRVGGEEHGSRKTFHPKRNYAEEKISRKRRPRRRCA
jgi:hypothetical protein